MYDMQLTRKKNRLSYYDYSKSGAYHIIICTEAKKKILCEILPQKDNFSLPAVILTEVGEAVKAAINNIEKAYLNISVAEYCIMPNHVHILLKYKKADRSVSMVISQLKANATKKIGKKSGKKDFMTILSEEKKTILQQ